MKGWGEKGRMGRDKEIYKDDLGKGLRRRNGRSLFC